MKIYLDLLPEDRKKEIYRNKLFYLSLKQEFLFLLPLLLLIGILIGVNWMLKYQKESIVIQNFQNQTKGQYQELGIYEDKFKATNEFSSSLLKIQKGHLHWANQLMQISSMLPDGVKVFNLASNNFKIVTTGNAKTRDELLVFKDNLEKNNCITDVNVPLSNMVERENVDFQLDFSIKPECLKQ